MTDDKQYLGLSELAYADLSSFTEGVSTLGDILQFVSSNPLYDHLTNLTSWTLVDYQDNTDSGFAGFALKNPATNEVVFAFRGSEFDGNETFITKLQDAIADLKLALPNAPAGEPNQFRDAYTFVKDVLELTSGTAMTDSQLSSYVAGNDINFTGHSLGGALVQYVIHELQAGEGTTFNSVGIGQTLGVANSQFYEDAITDYVNADDIVGNFGVQLGDTKYLQGTIDMTNVDKHAILHVVGLFTAAATGEMTISRCYLEIKDAMNSMNVETKSYLSGSLNAHLLSSLGNLTNFTTTDNHNLEWLLTEIAVFVEAVADSSLPNLLAGVDNLYTGVSSMANATVDFNTATENLVNQAVQNINDDLEQVVDATISDLRTAIIAANNDVQIITNEVGTAFFDISTQLAVIVYDANVQLVQNLLLGIDGFQDLFEAANIDGAALDVAKRIMSGESITDAIYSELEDRLGLAAEGIDDILDSATGIVTAIDSALSSAIGVIQQEASDHLDRILPAVSDLVGNITNIEDIFASSAADALTDLGQNLLDFGANFSSELVSFLTSFTNSLVQIDDGIGEILGAANSILTTSFSTFIESGPVQGIADFISLVTGVSLLPVDPNGSINGTEENDTIYGYSGANLIQTYGGNDTVYGGGGNDTLMGGMGGDTLLGGDGNDFLYGEAEGSTYSNYYGYLTDDILDGGVGNDLLAGSSGNDTYKFGIGYGQDVIDDKYRSWQYDSYGSGGALDTLSFLSGVSPENVKVHRRNETDLEFSIIGTNDKITILNFFHYSGGIGIGSVERVTFANGTVWDLATIQQKAQIITEATRQGDPSTTLTGYEGQNDIVYGTSSNNTINTYGGDDTAYGYGGDDIIVGSFGSDTLQGGAGNDSLYGETEDSTYTNYYQYPLDDILDGGAGDDFLAGGAGNDTYVFGQGYGQDVVDDKNRSYNYYSYGSGGVLDTLSFLAGVAPEDVSVHRRGESDLEFRIVGTTDKITVRDFFYYGSGSPGNGTLEQVTFANGTTWDINTILEKSQVITESTRDYDSSDTIRGYSSDDIIHGTINDDAIWANPGSDIAYGNAGNDTLIGGEGVDTLLGGDGNDTLAGDTLESTSTFASEDTLDGGTGNDLLVGGGGNDTYVFGRGYGQDTIDDRHRTYNYNNWSSGGYHDTISFLEDVAPEDILVHRGNGNDLEFRIVGTSDKITVQEFFTYNGGTGNGSIEQVVFSDGTIWDINTIREKARHIYATSSDDTITGYGFQDNIIHADAGNDTVSGSNGNDTLYGEAGDDALMASTGNDILDGGTGNDSLQGGGNDDIYVFGIGYGEDTIHDFADGTYGGHAHGGTDTIQLLEGIVPEDVTMQRVGDNLEITINGTTDKLTVLSYFSSNGYYSIENIEFADSTIWDAATIRQKAKIMGSSGDDILYGSSSADTLDGGTGNDIVEGGYGNDTYLFNVGSGNDVVYDSDSSEGNLDKIVFGSGISEEDVAMQRIGDDLVFSFDDSTDTLTIEKYFSQYGRQSGWSQPHVGINGNKIELIEFTNGTVWNNETVIEKISHILGTTGSDSLVGIEGQQSKLSGLDGDDVLAAASYGDYLDGGAGNDTLNGSSGQDALRGGIGDDALRGAEGKDTYVFATGSGHDTIYDGDGSFATDTISFLEGIDPSDVEASRNGNDLLLTINGGTDSITVQDYFSKLIQGSTYEYGVGVNKVERIVFADGTVWDTATLEDQLRFIDGTTSDDTLNGYETDDVISAQAGNDTVHAGAGNDVVTADTGNDTVYGEAGNDQLNGGEGNDTLDGNIGNDILDGGAGDDVLVGGEGNDTYVFGLGGGSDDIRDFSINANEIDTVSVQAGISPQDVTVQRDGDDLILLVANTTDSLTIKNYFSPYQDGDPTDHGVGVNKIEQVTFTDGTVWNSRTLEYAVNNNGIVDPNVTFGTSQNESLYADQDGQTIYADAGDDTITGSAVGDTLYGETGNDTISAGLGNDTLVGGAGNDSLDGGEGNDTYVFESGFGHDTIVDYDTTQGNTDTITFGADINPGDVTISRVGNNLILTLATGDSITVQSYFASAVSGHHKIEQVVFADSTVWDTSYLETAVPPTSAYDNTIAGTESDDYLYGTSTNDAITGGAGNDTVYSDGSMYDGIGNDLLDGGTGNDTLYGAGGDDTYVFGLGYGQEYVSDELREGGSQYGAHIDGGYDTLKLLPGVAPEDIIVRRSGMDLILEIAGTTDSMTIAGFFREVNGVYTSGIERVEFSDSGQTIWTLEDLIDKARHIDGTSADETLYGYEGQDNIINAGDGNDAIYGASANDTIIGGAGNDSLQGSYGNDTYVFAAGFGNDTIYDLDPTAGNVDTIQFLEGINPADVVVTRNGDDLVLSVTGTSDTLTVDQFFSQYTQQGYNAGGVDAQKIEVISFADSTAWSIANIKEKAETILGTVGDDSLSGYSDQENKIYAGDGNDTLYAASSTGDELYGEAGNDILYGSGGEDILTGGTGNDRLEGNSGNDTYIFAAGFGSDTVYDIDSTIGNSDTIQFLAGINPTDVVATRSSNDLILTITGTSDVLTIDQFFSGYTQAGYNAGGIDAQKVEAISFADGTTWDIADIKEKVETIHGTSGDDSLSGFGDQENKIYAGDGNDTVYAASPTGDELYGEAGNDALYGASGGDLLTGGTGNDTLQGSSGNDTYAFAAGFGSDIIYDIDSTEGNIDTIQFLAGINPADVVAVRNGDDLTLSITGTSDTLTIDQYFSGYTQQGYNAGGVDAQKVEVISFADGTTWSIADLKEKVETIHGTSGDDSLSGYGDQENNIYAGDGNDTVYAASSTGDELYGQAGNDTLYGASGADVLDGGVGSDMLEGSAGSDTYTFGLDYGSDTIYDHDSTVGNIDTVTFLAGIAPEDVIVKRSGDNLILSIEGANDTLTVERYFSPYARNSSYYYGENTHKIEEFHFADSTVWDIDTIKDKARYIEGTENNDTIYGFETHDVITADAGNDVVYAGVGNDVVNGGTGDDTLYGETGNNHLVGDSGNDTLIGGDGSDILEGGVGNDYLEGSTGNDTYTFATGFGVDTIYDNDSGQGNSLDAIEFAAGIASEDVKARRVGEDLELSVLGTDDKLIIERYFSPYYKNSSWNTGEGSNRIEEFRFTDNTVWQHADILDKVRYIEGTAGDDQLYGIFYDQQNVITAGAGNDTIYAASAQGDNLYGQSGNDSLYGASGADLLDGGTENDILEGSSGNDTYIFGLGYGADTIYDIDNTTGNTDTIQLLEGIGPEDVIATRSGDDLILTINGTSDSLTVDQYFSQYTRNGYNAGGPDAQKVEVIQFANGTIWNIADIKEKVRFIEGTSGNDSLSGFGDQQNIITAGDGDDTVYASSSLGDELYGESGSDTLIGASGNERFDGGIGNDYSEGSTGDDTYIFGVGYGQDVIYDSSQGQTGGIDKVTFLSGISPADVSVKRLSNSDLEITFAGTTDKLTIERYFSPYYKNSSWNAGADSNVIEELHFADGTIWDTATIKDKVRTINGSESNDSLQGFGDQQNLLYAGNGDDTVYAGGMSGDELYGEAGSDTLIGSYSNEKLNGGTGNDYLEGSAGDDTYVFGPGYGQDVIYDSNQGQTGGVDKIMFLAGINPTDITAKRLPNSDLELTFAGSSDKLTIERYFSPYYKNSSWNSGTDSNVVEEFHFADNTVWTAATIKDMVLTINGTENADTLYGYEGNETITAGADNDTVSASSGNDTLYGDAGNDSLYGEDGSDILNGGTGDDYLSGGYSDDIYVFSGAFGNDHIYDYHGSDSAEFDISKDNLIFEQVGNALQIISAGTSNTVIVDYWYQYTDHQVETVEASDGSTISNTQIEQLIQAMATWSANNNGMSWSQALTSNPQDVQSIVSQYWTAPTV